MAYLTDIEIAQSCKMKPIGEIASKAGIGDEFLEPYGRYKAKVDLSYLKSNAVELRINLHIKDDICERLLKQTYTSRIDEARDAIRASESRLILNGETINPLNTVDKEYGDITIDNKYYARYMGELQILKTNQKSDNRVNKVASIIQNDFYLLKYIRNQKKFYFKII